MDTQEMDRQLRVAWKMLLRLTGGDEERATDAFPYVWKMLANGEGFLCWRTIRRALYRHANRPFWGTGAGHKTRADALRGARQLFTYSTAQRRERNPARHAEINEAVRLVFRVARTRLQGELVRSYLDGDSAVDRNQSRGKHKYSSCSSWRWFRGRCRRLYPSLIGIA